MIHLKRTQKIEERITKQFLERLERDLRMFLKNIQRVDSKEDIYEVNEAWIRWVYDVFMEKMYYNVAGIGTDQEWRADTAVGRRIKKFGDFLPTAFLPTKKQMEKYYGKGSDQAYYYGPEDYVNQIYRGNKDIVRVMRTLYTVWERYKTSNYNRIKKRVDEFFEDMYRFIENTGGFEEVAVTDIQKIDGATVKLVYHEDKQDVISNMFQRLKRIFEAVKEAGFKKSLKGIKIELNPGSVEGEKQNIDYQGRDVKTGGYYRISMDEIKIFSAGINDFMFGLTIHEIGHRFYYEFMTKKQREEWESFLNQPITDVTVKEFRDAVQQVHMNEVEDYISEVRKITSEEISQEDAIERVGKGFTSLYRALEHLFGDVPGYEFLLSQSDAMRIIRSIDKDPATEEFRKQYGVLSPKAIRDLTINFQTYGEEKITSMKRLIQLAPTEYAKKNESEFFAEVFAAYCLKQSNFEKGMKSYKPVKFYEPAFKKFIEITGVRSATHEGARVDKAPFYEFGY